jgi:hypothetical protein
VFDEGEDVVRRTAERGGGEEVAGQDGVSLAAQERWPGGVVTVRGGLDPVPLEDLPDGGGCDRDPEAGEFAVDAAVTPGVVSRARRSMSAWMERRVGGRPGRFLREILAWCRRIRSRCQRRIVSGETISCKCSSRTRGSLCRSAARNTRSVPVSRGVSIWRCRMASWWRNAKISMSLSVPLTGSSLITVNTLDTARYDSLSSTADQSDITAVDLHPHTGSDAQRSQ